MSISSRLVSNFKRTQYNNSTRQAEEPQQTHITSSSDRAQSPTDTLQSNNTDHARNEYDSPEAGVFYNPIALEPGCASEHRQYQTKRKAGERCSVAVAKRCGEKNHRCHQSVIVSEDRDEALKGSHAGNATHRLKSWILIPDLDQNSHLKAHDIDFLRNNGFTDRNIFNAIKFSLTEIRYQNLRNDYLADYLLRPPYNRNLKADVAAEANLDYLSMQPQDFIGAPRYGLEEDLIGAADEICKLRLIEEKLIGVIAEEKKDVVRLEKDAVEAEQLFKMGFIDHKWLQKNCPTLL